MDDADLAQEYVPQLIKLDDPPRLEYVTKDCAMVYHPVGDGRLFYMTDMEAERKIVGFQLLLPPREEVTPEMRRAGEAHAFWHPRDFGGIYRAMRRADTRNG